MHGDEYVIKAVVNSLYDKGWSVPEDFKLNPDYTDRQLKSILVNCP